MKTLGKWMKTNVGLLFAILPIFVLAAEPALAQNLDPLENMLQTFFDGSAEKAMAALLDRSELSEKDLDRLAKLIAEAREEGR